MNEFYSSPVQIYDSPFGGVGGAMFDIIPVIVIGGFVLVFALIIAQAVRGAKQWNKNNNSPVLTVDATVVAKRGDVHHHHGGGVNEMHHTSTTYYVTFEVSSGDRIEFQIADQEYGMLVEGDVGKLTFQGTRYLEFTRQREE